MKKGAKIVLGSAGLILLATLFFDLYVGSQNKIDVSTMISICNDEYTLEEVYLCVRENAWNSTDPDYCEKIFLKHNDETRMIKDWCYSGLAGGNTISEYCDKIEDEFPKDQCFYSVASGNSDNELCLRITNDFYKEKCSKRIEIVRELKEKESINIG